MVIYPAQSYSPRYVTIAQSPTYKGGEVSPIYISYLSLANFRNYESLELNLAPGMHFIQGANGQGKSNLLEAIYVLAIAKSSRAASDRELIRGWPSLDSAHCQVSAIAQRGGEQLRVQIDLSTTSIDPRHYKQLMAKEETAISNSESWAPQTSYRLSIQKRIRVNGAPRRSHELIGQISVVQFSASDLEIVYGAPSLRRRYLDILLSQLDNRYLRALQRYQRVVYQRNHLLRRVRDGRAEIGELEFWNEGLVEQAGYIMSQRLATLRSLSKLADPLHRNLTSENEGLCLVYRPNVKLEEDSSMETINERLRTAMNRHQAREVAQGASIVGPHRDDIEILVGGKTAETYASRGQARTIILAMKLGEMSCLTTQRQIEPILLLDDILSELDSTRRNHVLKIASKCEQCFITATDAEPIDEQLLSQMSRFTVHQGIVTPDTALSEIDADGR